MTQAEHIILTTRKKRKRQMILKGLSAVYMTIITALLIYIFIHIDFSLITNSDNTDQPPSVTPTPIENMSDNQTNNTPPSEIDTKTKYIALTYDDGPSNYTSHLLDALEEHNAKATFFIIGNRAEQYRDTIKRMHHLGMEIASHTYGHDVLTKLDANSIQDTMNKTDEALISIIGHGANLMRPVGGGINDLVQSTVNKPIIRWDVDTLDWKTRDTEAIVDHVLENVKDGSVILMHDIYPTTIEASTILIPKLQEMGYQLVTIPELAKIRGIELLPGEIYRFFPSIEQQLTENLQLDITTIF